MEHIKKIKTRIDFICENKINAFSPTISPAFKSKERNEIESILEAVKYFVDKGQTELIFQKKYMGSYCDIYLHKNIEESYLASRNAHKISYLDKEVIIDALRPIHSRLSWENISLRIIQSELLPWSVLGKGLIENEFGGYLHAHQTHIAHLQHSTLYKKIENVKNSLAYREYITDKKQLPYDELTKRYAAHIIRQYNAIDNFIIVDFESYKQGIDIYERQLNHFGKSVALSFKPFNILKEIYEDGTENIINDNLSYRLVNDDEMLELTIDSNLDLMAQLTPVYNWYSQLTESLEEGIMIKPKTAFIKGLPPAFKVRNNQYLTLIYGIDFINNYKANMEKRNVKKKLSCSINDWMQNWKLLKIKYNKIDKENYEFKNILLDRIIGEQLENKLDHRL